MDGGGYYLTMQVIFFSIICFLHSAVILQPNNTRWLSAPEQRLAQARLAEDAAEADQDRAEDSYV